MDATVATACSRQPFGTADVISSCDAVRDTESVVVLNATAAVVASTNSNNNRLIKSLSAPTSSRTQNGTAAGDVANGDCSKGIGRRVSFPADDLLVTGYVEPPNPWENGKIYLCVCGGGLFWWCSRRNRTVFRDH